MAGNAGGLVLGLSKRLDGEFFKKYGNQYLESQVYRHIYGGRGGSLKIRQGQENSGDTS